MRHSERIRTNIKGVGWGGGGGGYSDIFIHTCKLGSFFGLKFLNFDIFWGFQKNEYFLGYEDFVDFFFFFFFWGGGGGHYKRTSDTVIGYLLIC